MLWNQITASTCKKTKVSSSKRSNESVHAEAFKARIARPLHPLVASHYFNKYFLRLDIMHIIDLKGVIAIAAGSLLLPLVQNDARLGRRQDERMAEINKQMKEFQSQNGTQHTMPPIRYENLHSDGWACLGSKLVKAANSRCLVPFLRHLAEKYYNSPHGGYAKSVRKIFKALDDVEAVFYSADMFLTDAEKLNLETSFNILGRHWHYLRHLSHTDKRHEWFISPKVHYATHAIAEQSKLINPKAVQNYGEESLVGRVTKLWGAAANGPYHAKAQLSTLCRYLVGLNIRLASPHY